MCCLKYPVKVRDWYRKDVVVTCEKDLHETHKKDEQQQADEWTKKTKKKTKPNSDFFKWVVKRGVCPYGIISSNTRYWLELMSVYDSEMGLNTPLPYYELPAIFFEVLRIYRENRPAEPKETLNGK